MSACSLLYPVSQLMAFSAEELFAELKTLQPLGIIFSHVLPYTMLKILKYTYIPQTLRRKIMANIYWAYTVCEDS